MTENRWKRKARALAKLAEDQRGKPEGDLARQKLLEIINKHPEAANYEPVKELVERDLTMKDIGWMKRHGVSTDGEWTGGNLNEAIALMIADYKSRMTRAKRKRLVSPIFELDSGKD